MSRTVRVGIDFSAPSTVALDHGVAIARKLGVGLEIVHASDAFADHHIGGEPHPEELVAFVDEVESEARVELEAIRERCAAAGIDATARIVRGKPVDALSGEADDIAVLGATGRSGLDRFLVGSTATRVIRAGGGSALIARPGRSRYERILVATDFEDASVHALETALALAVPGARVDLLHAWRLPNVFTGYLPAKEHKALIDRLVEQTADGVKAQADALLDRVRDQRVELIAARGDAASEIVDRSAGYDLVAVGSHGRGGLARFLAGSVAERVVAHSACSVLVAH